MLSLLSDGALGSPKNRADMMLVCFALLKWGSVLVCNVRNTVLCENTISVSVSPRHMRGNLCAINDSPSLKQCTLFRSDSIDLAALLKHCICHIRTRARKASRVHAKPDSDLLRGTQSELDGFLLRTVQEGPQTVSAGVR